MKKPLTERAALLTKEDVAELSRLGVRTVERLVSRGVLRRFKPAGLACVRFRREEVETWLRAGCPSG